MNGAVPPDTRPFGCQVDKTQAPSEYSTDAETDSSITSAQSDDPYYLVKLMLRKLKLTHLLETFTSNAIRVRILHDIYDVY